MKICSKCKVNKSLDQFRIRKERKSGYRSDCKECEYKYSQLNRREYFNKYQRDRRKNDSLYKMSWNIRTSIAQSFLRTCNGKFIKNNKTQEILGCSFEFFLNFISSQFKDGMSLERLSEIHLDHIIPISSAKTEEDLYKLCHYTNLQPLWAEDNLRKNRKI